MKAFRIVSLVALAFGLCVLVSLYFSRERTSTRICRVTAEIRTYRLFLFGGEELAHKQGYRHAPQWQEKDYEWVEIRRVEPLTTTDSATRLGSSAALLYELDGNLARVKIDEDLKRFIFASALSLYRRTLHERLAVYVKKLSAEIFSGVAATWNSDENPGRDLEREEALKLLE